MSPARFGDKANAVSLQPLSSQGQRMDTGACFDLRRTVRVHEGTEILIKAGEADQRVDPWTSTPEI